jgi:GT2 family glycosyltransferase
MSPAATVVVPTHNRPDAVATTVHHLLESAGATHAEVIVVDDGGSPPLSLPAHEALRVVRTPGVERSQARNLGALAARGPLVIFVDDDITVRSDFVERHLDAARQFGDVIAVGRISLLPELLRSPVGRFRRTIEEPAQDRARGFVADQNFCTAANMSMRRASFLALGGFDPAILSGEDQDLALRSSRGGRPIVYLPEAEVLHRDSINSIGAYARRHEWGARAMAPLLRRYPDRSENIARLQQARALGEARSPREFLRLFSRLVFSKEPFLMGLGVLIPAIERSGAGDAVLFPLYRALLGLRMFRGFRRGLGETRKAAPLPSSLVVARSESGRPD